MLQERTQVKVVTLFLGQLGGILSEVALIGAFLARLLVQVKLLVYHSKEKTTKELNKTRQCPCLCALYVLISSFSLYALILWCPSIDALRGGGEGVGGWG
jgi:hypothetical protein